MERFSGFVNSCSFPSLPPLLGMLGLALVVILAVTMGRSLVELVGVLGYRVIHN